MLDPATVVVDPIFWQVWRPDSSGPRNGRFSGGMLKGVLGSHSASAAGSSTPALNRGHARGGKIIPLDLELRGAHDIWLSYHPGNGRILRVRHMIDRLGAAFDPAKFQWSKDEFLHPMELKAVYMGESPAHLFIRGFSTEGR
jgi:hypothetical protein